MESPGKKFTDLVEIESIQDTDLTVVRNDTGVKKTPMQKLSDYIKKKFIGWVFSDLPTKDKTIPGALKELNSALVVKTYKSESEVNGFECTAIAQGNVVTFKVRGTAATNLGTNNQYAYCGTFSKLKPLISENADHIKRVVITHQYLGQLRFDVGTCQLRMGYTFNYNGNAVDVPKGTTFYLEEIFVL